MKKKISILLADDNKYMLDSLSTYIETQEDLEVISKVENGREALELIEKGDCDIIVLDLSMPEFDGFEVLRQLKIKNIKTPVLIFTNYNEENHILTVKKMGASGYVCKTETPDKLVSAIRKIASGEQFFNNGKVRVANDR
jgi:DNA-binding NarL/FixJ family response regulator